MEGSDNQVHSPEYYKEFLYKIYQCRTPFEIRFRKTKPKHYVGLYVIDKHRINLYPNRISSHNLEEVAIHEYAHHIHHTEQYTGDRRGIDRSHGEKFWRIYSALRARAMELGLMEDDLIEDILKNN